MIRSGRPAGGGVGVGVSVGVGVGVSVGDAVGVAVGAIVGRGDRLGLGRCVASADGDSVGIANGEGVATTTDSLGAALGAVEAPLVGIAATGEDEAVTESVLTAGAVLIVHAEATKPTAAASANRRAFTTIPALCCSNLTVSVPSVSRLASQSQRVAGR